MTRIGVRAFEAVGDLMELDDTETVGELDLRIVSSVMGMQAILEESLATIHRFEMTFAATNAGNPNRVNARTGPTTIGDWDNVDSNRGAGVMPVAGSQRWLTGMGVFSSSNANFTDASFITSDGTIEIGIGMWNTAINNNCYHGPQLGYYGQLPFLLNSFLNQSQDFLVNVSGNSTISFWLEMVTTPRGLVSLRR